MAQRVCPHWVGCLLLNPLRRLIHNPDQILASYVTGGMTVLDIGPGMGFFTLPLARMVGPGGKVIGVDNSRGKCSLHCKGGPRQYDLAERIVTVAYCQPTSLGLDDFAGRSTLGWPSPWCTRFRKSQVSSPTIFMVLKPGKQYFLVAESEKICTSRSGTSRQLWPQPGRKGLWQHA